MKVIIFLGMLFLMVSCSQAISKKDLIESFSLEERRLIQNNEQPHELNVTTTRYRMGGRRRLAGFGGGMGGGGRMGGGGMGKGGMGGGGGGGKGGGGKGGKGGGGKGGRGGRAGPAAGGAAAGMIGGGLVGGAIVNHNNNNGKNDSSSSATTLSAWAHFFVSILILCVSFWI
ncbi:glycine-rich cell wall structural protein-like [Lathyrus oleraceus]|uniref:glycine-rich cell wall structural protein-like n=1 Tax=Pisum sativum TaxID=3888 RepID=UPI0021CEFAA1|nr:glycine-rich cell wall structural protein-like [Pisum sativum]